MTFISYAQNFEDLMLWRALRHVEQGFYIDVGASHPDTDSVTRAFFERGWRGINIEPGLEDAARIAAARPGDITLQLAAGRRDGEMDFFAVPGTGLSTLDPAVAATYRDPQWHIRRGRIAVRTLAGICAAHVRGPIHFLKIDVEGAEADVLAGADLTAYRPWIILVEATAPLSTAPAYAAWEPGLLRQGYRFAWFDGLNRFYLAEEHADGLAQHFLTPPNVFDDFIRAIDTNAAARLAAAEARALTLESLLTTNVLRAAEAAAAAAERADLHNHEIARLQAALAKHRQQSETRDAEQAVILHQARHDLHQTHVRLAAVLRSTSWRLTGPLRLALERLGRASAQPPLPATPPPPAELETAAIAALAAPAPPLLQHPGRPRHAVHQFHSGSAVGDAITNAMLLTRTILRDMGYASEIFVTHVDARLAHELRSIDAMPLHDDYVLVLRHSIGHDEFERIATLPAPKILIYHNITPTDLLTRHPVLAAYAELGRRQLATLPGRVYAALADSEYNAVELRQLGFDPVQSCALLFDLAVLRARAAAAAIAADEPGGIFTILFVGRICQSKAQAELIEAYAAFRALHPAPARLVLIGRHDGDDDPYLQAVKRAIATTPHPTEVILTGLVSDDERDSWYARADLYVSLSRHEGFGVPLVEAMAHGVAILARPSGAVPYTVGDPACLLPEDASPGNIGAILQLWAADPARRATHAASGLQGLDRFALPAQSAILQAALHRAGAALPTHAARAGLAANLHFAIAGHVNKTYSLSAVNRGLARSLDAARPGRVRLIPVEGVITSDLSEVPETERAGITALVARPAPLTAPELIVSQHYPIHVPPRIEGQIRLALLFWEESLLPAETIATLEAGFDGVVAPTRFVARALQDSGLRLPVRVIDHAPPLSVFHALPRSRQPDARTTFLHVSSCFPRKGADLLLRAWAAAFTASDPVRLLIKSFPNPHNTIAADLAAFREAHPDLAPITLVDEDLDQTAIAELYAQSDVMVLPSRGEGYNLPAAEALAAGLRLIVTGAGGHMDFCGRDDPRIRLLRYRHAPSESHLATPHSLWLEPDAGDLAAALREAVETPAPIAPATACPSSGPADDLTAFGLDLLLRPPPTPVRVAWVSSWAQRCGVAEYSRLMLDARAPDCELAITVLCDNRTVPYAPLPGSLPHVPCWELGCEAPDDLLDAIARTDPHAVVIQHQPGLIPWPTLARLIDGIVAQQRVVTITLHNSRHLLDLPAEEQTATFTALSRADRVIVHTLADLDRLTSLQTALGLPLNTTLFPQGTTAPIPGRQPRSLGATAAPVIGSYGFFLPGKGIDTLIEAVLKLREQWPGLQLRLVNAAYDHAEPDAAIDRARILAEPLGAAVQFHTGFLPQAHSLALLSECDLIVLPYRPSKEASSAALRTALTSSVPVAVSQIALFDEAGDAVFRVDADNADNLARDLATLLHDTASRQTVQQAARDWMEARAWPPLIRRLTGLMTGLLRSRT